MISTSLRVRFYETDMMEIAHHTNHLRWFEMGRIEYFRRCGISLWDMMQEGIVFPITKGGKYARDYWKDSYYLGQNGELARDTWIGSYYVDSTGKWNSEM